MTVIDFEKVNNELFAFLEGSPNAYFAVANMVKELEKTGYLALQEEQTWLLQPGGKYYVVRNDSAIIAFQLPQISTMVPSLDYEGFSVFACHCDSPAFKLKRNAELALDAKYVKLNVEKYGGMIMYTWLDRPLSIAGRVLVMQDEGIKCQLVNLDQMQVIIPSLAIHMNGSVNEGYKFNVQTDLLPLCGSCAAKGKLMELLASAIGTSPEAIIDYDLYLYNKMAPTVYGFQEEYIASGRLDDLQCAFGGFKGFLQGEPKKNIALFCMLDNEEVGSGTRQGAASTFLKDTLKRINNAMGKNEEDYYRAIAKSFMISADNGHAAHPNHMDKSDATNRPFLNEGIVIKYSANQKYTTDAVAGALLRAICKQADIPVQVFANRSDMLGGSTLGNISGNQVPIKTVDIGLAQLAMHSAYETAGVKDTGYLVELAKKLFSTNIENKEPGLYVLEQ